jgi:di/tricarboxylate transporter
MGSWLVKVAGNSETKMLVYLMLTVAGLGAFMSSTGVVAIFIPVVLSVSMRMNTSPSRLMMPLSFAGLISGMMTLVATPPNLVVNSELLREGLQGFSFFSVTPIGLVVLVLGVFYMLVMRFMLKGDEGEQAAMAVKEAPSAILSKIIISRGARAAGHSPRLADDWPAPGRPEAARALRGERYRR